MNKEADKPDNGFVLWFKNATQYSILVLVCVILFIMLIIGTKDKINMNFSKRSNQYVIGGLLLIILYIYRTNVDHVFNEIRKDAINPGSGIIRKNIISAKAKLLSLNDGYVRTQYENIIMGMDDLVNNLMLQTVLSVNQSNPQQSLIQLGELNNAKAALNNVMKFIDGK